MKRKFKAPKWFVEMMDERRRVMKEVVIDNCNIPGLSEFLDGDDIAQAAVQSKKLTERLMATPGGKKEFANFQKWSALSRSIGDDYKGYAYRKFYLENRDKIKGLPGTFNYDSKKKEITIQDATGVLGEMIDSITKLLKTKVKQFDGE